MTGSSVPVFLPGMNWLSVPGDQYACEGDNVSFYWEYNISFGTHNLTTITKSYHNTTTYYLTKLGNDNPVSPEGIDTVYLGNAGMMLYNVSIGDAGVYISSVRLMSGLHINDSSLLTVYPATGSIETYEYFYNHL